jgi:hypothetical protein
MKRDPLGIIHRIANAVSKLEPGTRLNPNQLAKRAGISWETALKYAQIVSVIQNKVPHIELSGDNQIVLLANPYLAASRTPTRLLQRLYHASAFTEASAIRVDSMPAIEPLMRKGLIRRAGEATWLTIKGIPEAFAAVDQLDSHMHRAFASIGAIRRVEEVGGSRQASGPTRLTVDNRDSFGRGRRNRPDRVREDPLAA